MSHLDFLPFTSINLEDEFFNSLKQDYAEFSDWYRKKAQDGAMAYVLFDDVEKLIAFVYLKVEDEAHDDMVPILPRKKRLKVGTLKVDAHGTRLGERIIKKIMDNASERDLDEIYVTVFPKHRGLLQGLLKYGFKIYGEKTTANGVEKVLTKTIGDVEGDLYKDYPCIVTENANFWSLAIWPAFHTRMFPDSILNNESYDLLSDVAPTNSIRKIYIAGMDAVRSIVPGDVVFIYRTTDHQGPARFRSVITSACILEEQRHLSDFSNEDHFVDYCLKSSIFEENELRKFYRQGKYPYVLKMTYNIAFKKRVTNHQLQEEIGLRPDYWGVFSMTRDQALKVFELGECNFKLIL